MSHNNLFSSITSTNFLSMPYISYIGLGVGLFSILTAKFINYGSLAEISKGLKGKIVIITGANEGIGKQTALELLKKGAKVIFACRDSKKVNKIIEGISSLEERNNAEFMYIDLASFKSVYQFINAFKAKYNNLDYLINNASTGTNEINHVLSENYIDITFQTNYFTPVILINNLLCLLSKDEGGRIINLTSYSYVKAQSYVFTYLKNTIPEKYMFEQDTSWADSKYILSKAFLNMFSLYYADHLIRQNINVQIVTVNPGLTYNPNFNKYLHFGRRFYLNLIWPFYWFMSQNQYRGAQTTLYCVGLKENEVINGGYYSNCEFLGLTPFAKDNENINSLIKFTDSMIKFYGNYQ